jgi:hypothetical protein
MDTPHAEASDRDLFVGIGLPVELTQLGGRQRTTKLHQNLAGNGRPSIHRDDLARWRGVPLCRGGGGDERSTCKRSAHNWPDSLHASASKRRRSNWGDGARRRRSRAMRVPCRVQSV